MHYTAVFPFGGPFFRLGAWVLASGVFGCVQWIRATTERNPPSEPQTTHKRYGMRFLREGIPVAFAPGPKVSHAYSMISYPTSAENNGAVKSRSQTSFALAKAGKTDFLFLLPRKHLFCCVLVLARTLSPPCGRFETVGSILIPSMIG